MGEIETRNYQKSLQRILAKYETEVASALKDIDKINAELERLEAKGELTPDEAKVRDRCLAARAKLMQKVEGAHTSLRIELGVLTPPPEMSKSDLQKITDLVKNTAKSLKKGLRITDNVRLEPDVEFDWKKRKFKKLGVQLKWTF
jgi:hypothetical protein